MLRDSPEQLLEVRKRLKAVGVGVVVGMAECFCLVLSVAEVSAGEPSSILGVGAPVADMEPWLAAGGPIRFTARGGTQSSCSRFDRSTAHGSAHVTSWRDFRYRNLLSLDKCLI